MKRRLATLFACGFALLPVTYGQAKTPSRPVVHACTEGKTKVPALCGTFEVYENRATHSGRTIELGFVLLLARHRSGRMIYFNPGGPGAPATEYAGGIADGLFLTPLSTLRERYDILLLDNRGMGDSHPLDCGSIYSPANPGAVFLAVVAVGCIA